MAPTISELEACTIIFSLLVFALFTLSRMLSEDGSNVTCFQDEVWRQGINYVIINEQTNSCLNKLSKALSFFLCVRQERKVILAGSLHSKHLLVCDSHVCMKQMDLPFSGFELTFITIAFFIFSLYSLASIYIQPSAADSDIDCGALESKALTKKQRVITKEAKWRPS